MLKKEDILSIIASELSNSSDSFYDGTTSLEESLSYYLGLPNGTEVEGRSSVVSTDVADTIEWILPQIMKSFTQNNEIVIFDPVHQGDEKQAELESEYVYEVLMKQNDGFIILHQFVKDALMQRNGILKVYYAKHTQSKIADYTGITTDQLEALLSAEGVELLERSEYVDQNATTERNKMLEAQMQQIQQQVQQGIQQAQQQPQQDPNQVKQQLQQAQQQMQQIQEQMSNPIMLNDVKVSASRKRGQIYVDPVPPEEFRVNSSHNSINLDKARFTAHVTVMTVSDVMEEYGLSFDETEELPDGSTAYDKEYRFAMQDESVFYEQDDSEDPSQRLISVAECFMKMDIDEVGIAKLMKITVAGEGDDPVDIIKVEEIEGMPWVATTTFLMSHKFEGLSITDRLKQIQDQKTAIWRNMLDNMYLQNNQRNVVVEGQVNMDDLLISRPGGIIRAKRLDAIQPLITPSLGQDSYQMMEYLDRVRAGRAGVDPDGGASPQNIGDRVGSQGVDRLMNAKEELVGLIIRVIAETGIKPLCVKIRDLTIKHVDSVIDFRFRGQWQQVKPSEWLDRTQCTVRVGTGTGNHAAQVAAITQVMAIQEKIMANPMQSMIGEKQIFTAIDDFCKFSGLNGANRYFIDPEGEEGKKKAEQNGQASQEAKQKQEATEQAMLKAQVDISQAELTKAQAAVEVGRAKAKTDQVKNQLALVKQTTDAQLASLRQELEKAKAVAAAMGRDADLDYKYHQTDTSAAIELTRIEAAAKSEENANYLANKQSVEKRDE